MNKEELIDELISELCLLHGDGLPHLNSSESLSYISEFFKKRGMVSEGNTVIQNLLEDGKRFKNPALNKVIRYKNVNGEDAEGKVGNLLRRPKEEDAYQKAVATLGGKDSDTYKKAMGDLGGEGQPQRDIEGEREAGDEGEPKGEEPQTATAFDPNTKGGKAYLKGLPDTDPAKPDFMKDDSEETLSAGGVVYPVGGGYYADTPDGEPKYRKATEEGVDKMDFRYILEEEDVVGKQVVKTVADTDGGSETMVVMGDTEVEKAKDVITGNGYTGTKNKTLKDVNPTESEEYNRDLEPTDEEFEEKNRENANPTPPEPISLEGIVQNPKFPKRYIKVLERMVNSRYTDKTKKWEHFSTIAGGAGLAPAQAGELMAMMGSTMGDAEWDTFKNKILDYEDSLKKNHPDIFMKKNKSGRYVDNPGSRIVDKSWVTAADNNRKIILKRLKKQYGDEVEVIASAWDTESEVESLGMENYKENKGFSTDMYLRIRKPNGEDILDEISLKKSKLVNFLNSGAGQFFNWLGDDVPDEINQNVYRDTERNNLAKTGEKLKSQIQQLLESDSPKAKELKKFFKGKGVDFETALADTMVGKGSRDKSNVILQSIKALANWPSWGTPSDKGPNPDGDPIAIQHLKNVSEIQNKFIEESISALANNPKMKEGMLKTIKEEFPLKAVSDGEETMAIGDMSLDRLTMEKIFGTSDFNKIKEKLVSEEGPPPFLGYRAEVGGEVIPIAEVAVREDGVGYGGQFKFEMKLDSRFAKILEKATSEIYS